MYMYLDICTKENNLSLYIVFGLYDLDQIYLRRSKQS